jgi:hypothetical protein
MGTGVLVFTRCVILDGRGCRARVRRGVRGSLPVRAAAELPHRPLSACFNPAAGLLARRAAPPRCQPSAVQQAAHAGRSGHGRSRARRRYSWPAASRRRPRRCARAWASGRSRWRWRSATTRAPSRSSAASTGRRAAFHTRHQSPDGRGLCALFGSHASFANYASSVQCVTCEWTLAGRAELLVVQQHIHRSAACSAPAWPRESSPACD